ncbi:MAG: HNH endonuclease, partial [Deltaproteobacteria bacterium]|nr:HNH endonuclease [Candidatus Tharpellaceae bacterium]
QNLHLDHIQPISKGGMHSIHNVQWLCKTCNLQKGNKYEQEKT